MATRIDEIADGIFRISTLVPEIAPPAGFGFNQFLVVADEPLLFHCGMRSLFGAVSASVATVIPIEKLRWISFGHVEADECGAMNAWLAAAPHAQVVHGMTACMVSLNDLADRPPRALADGEVLDLGGKRVRWIDTPHVPHAWESGLMFEETMGPCFAATSSPTPATVRPSPPKTSLPPRSAPRKPSTASLWGRPWRRPFATSNDSHPGTWRQCTALASRVIAIASWTLWPITSPRRQPTPPQANSRDGQGGAFKSLLRRRLIEHSLRTRVPLGAASNKNSVPGRFMTIRSTLAVAAGISAFVIASGVSAQQFKAEGRVEHSGHTFHAKVCPTFEGPGTARCFAHVVTDAAGNILTRDAARNLTPSGYGSATLRAAYGISPAMGAPGSGATVAIVDAFGYPNAASDLAVYRSTMGLGACTVSSGCLTIVNQNGGNRPPKTNTGWDQEQALDLDMVSSMCPNCKILLVQASSTSYSNLGQAVNTAAALGALVISNSYGGGEGGTTNYEPDYNHPNVTILASAGDSGYGAQFPATSPHVVAAGGTSLTMNGNAYGSETVWSGTGSGCSTVYMAPTWQVGTVANSTCKARMETDVSAVADPNTGVAVYGPPGGTRSAWMVFGGTSVASPLLGGIYGEVGKSCGGLGSSDPNSYCASKLYNNASAFHDITVGNNGSCSVPYYCTAETGYDGPTGLGTPNGATAF